MPKGRAILLSQTEMIERDRHAIQVTRLTSAGALDPTFGGDGTAVVRLPTGIEEARDIAVQGSKILVLATSRQTNPDESLEYSVVRLNGSGSLDKSFGTDGILATPSTKVEAFDPQRIIVSRTGHIYVLSGHSAASAAIHRFTADGQLDTSFGVNGIVDVAGEWAIAGDLIELKDNSLVVALKYSNGATNFMMRLAHISRDGVIDDQFATAGRHEIALTNNQMYSNYGRVRLGLDAQDNIYVAGMRRTDTAQDFFVQKLSKQGVLDTAYGVGGEATIATGQEWGTLIQDVMVSASGEATLSGTMYYTSWPFVLRVSATGVPDTSLGGVGINIVATTNTNSFGMGGLVRLGSGQLLAAYSNVSTRQIDLFSFDNYGAANNTFGNAGKVSLNLVQSRFVAEGLAMTELADGKLLSLTRDLVPDPPEQQISYADLILTRYLPSGTIDQTYGDNGQLRLNVDAFDSKMHDPIFSHNGVKYLAYTEKSSKLRIGRLGIDGTIDTTFGTAGWIEWEYPRGTNYVYQTDSVVAVDDGFIVTSGGSGGLKSSGYLITKLDRDGHVVSGFGVGGLIAIGKESAAGTFTKVVAWPDGSFAVMMSHPSDATPRFSTIIRKYTASGQIDSSFGQNGNVVSDLSAWTYTTDRQIMLRDDGRIVTFGGSGQAGELIVEQYTSSGALDPNFGSSGRLRIQTGADASYSRALLIDSQDRLVLVAKNRIKGEENALVYRLTPSGAFDMSFGKDGVRRLFLSQYDDQLDTVTELANGDLILAGTCITDSTIEPVFVKLGEHVSDWYNGGMRHDVNEDEAVSAIDALLIINRLNSISTASLPQQKPDGAPLVDVNGDNNCTPLDALLVINLLNLNSAGNGEGESEGEGESNSFDSAPTLSQATAVDWSLDSVVEQWRRRLSR